jgi:diguanylate cyclase (GGDEF)-like protein
MPNQVAQRQGMIRVLLIDAALEDVRRIRSLLQKQGDFRIHSARDMAEAEAQLSDGVFDVALIDSALWSANGGDLVRLARERHLDLAVILLTQGNQREALPALKLGAHDFLSKQQLKDGEQVATRILAAVEESRSIRRRDTMVRWLEREARTDHLTGLNNRRAFDERLEEACGASQQLDQPVALIMVDVAGTRQVNENHGHHVGDAMIRRTARGIGQCIRGGDFAARIGGDDFGIIISGGDMDLARRISRRIAHEIERLNHEDPDTVPVSLTFGVASGVGCEPAELFAAADQQVSAHKNVRPAVTYLFPRHDSDGPSVA